MLVKVLFTILNWNHQQIIEHRLSEIFPRCAFSLELLVNFHQHKPSFHFFYQLTGFAVIVVLDVFNFIKQESLNFIVVLMIKSSDGLQVVLDLLAYLKIQDVQHFRLLLLEFLSLMKEFYLLLKEFPRFLETLFGAISISNEAKDLVSLKLLKEFFGLLT